MNEDIYKIAQLNHEPSRGCRSGEGKRGGNTRAQLTSNPLQLNVMIA
jgi:hypothetical protein